MDGICNLCGGSPLTLIRDGLRDGESPYKVHRCAACGHVQLYPRPSIQDDREYYGSNLQDRLRGKEIDYEVLRTNQGADTERHADMIDELPDRGTDIRVLDIGAGYGFFLSELVRRGYHDVLGVEIGSERREIGVRNADVDIVGVDVCDDGCNVEPADVVTLFHVLEHVGEPVEFLVQLKRFVKPGGLLIVEVPNVDELLLERCEFYNDFYWIRAHLSYFSAKALCYCFKQAEIDKVDVGFVQRYGVLNLAHWLSSGEPQVDCPEFHIDEGYEWLDALYRDHLVRDGRSDTLVAVAHVRGQGGQA